jgi:hypothetical protein
MRNHRAPTITVIMVALVTVPACARQGDSTAATPAGAAPAPSVSLSSVRNLVPEGYTGRYRVDASVLESPQHGPQLCLAMAQSYPPQCGGMDVVGWSWTGLAHETARGTSWGSYRLTGTYDGTRLTLTEPAVNSTTVFEPSLRPDFTSPCTPPPGGWAPRDRAKTTDATLTRAIAQASAADGFAGAWVDQYGGPGAEDNDPLKTVLNVRFTGDLGAHETRLRKVWGGSLCVQKAARSEAELTRIGAELRNLPGLYSVSTDTVANSVQLCVHVATVALADRLAQQYGPDAVQLTGMFEPIDR